MSPNPGRTPDRARWPGCLRRAEAATTTVQLGTGRRRQRERRRPTALTEHWRGVLVPVRWFCHDRGALPLFGKRPAPLGEEERQAAAVDLERIAGGGIPLGAEQRLKRIAAGESAVFTSDLSAKEYAIAHASGLAPIAQIMGSSVVQHGWQNYGWSSYQGGIAEMPSFARPWNLSRERSFDRLRQEAQFAGADAVVGIEMTARAFLGDPGNVEYVVFGTAVRENTPDRMVVRDRGCARCRARTSSSCAGSALRRWASSAIPQWSVSRSAGGPIR